MFVDCGGVVSEQEELRSIFLFLKKQKNFVYQLLNLNPKLYGV
jgi:hypothetical protein